MSTHNSASAGVLRPACLGLVGLLVLLLLGAPGAQAATWEVGGGSGPRECETVASAVSQASNGDSVLIYPGNYNEAVICTKSLAFVANGSPGSVTICPTGAVALTLAGVEGSVLIESIRFSNGSGLRGGGVLVESVSGGVQIRDCVFDGNHATQSGGAIDAWGAVVTIDGCSFVSNTVASGSTYGGAVVLRPSSAGSVISNCIFEGNWAPLGGAIYHSGDITVTGCTFTQNGAGDDGGAIASASPSGATIWGCRFRENASNDRGGAIFVSGSSTAIQYCIFDDNSSSEGGDIHFIESGNQVTNCTFYRGRGTSAGGALYFDDVTGTVSKSIFCRIDTGSSAVHVEGSAEPVFQCNCFHDNATGDFSGMASQVGLDGNFAQDPQFCGGLIDGEILDGNLNLQSDSPCASGNAPGGCAGQLGACGVACGTTLVETTSWGQVKARFH